MHNIRLISILGGCLFIVACTTATPLPDRQSSTLQQALSEGDRVRITTGNEAEKTITLTAVTDTELHSKTGTYKIKDIKDIKKIKHSPAKTSTLFYGFIIFVKLAA
ncbi:MAG: hypothetical protein OEX12_13650 [Gammaproteobacteria bacterium]|nr:hypothetical protein [Gammaproteobacteria bacterium]